MFAPGHDLCVAELVEAKRLEVHDVADIEAEDPVFDTVVFQAQVRPCFDLELFLVL